MIYVLVKVSYDHYRFQENVFAGTSRQGVYEWMHNEGEKIPMIIYSAENADDNESSGRANPHYWLQEFEG